MGRHRKIGRPKGSWTKHKPKVGRPRKVGRPKGCHTKWGQGKNAKFSDWRKKNRRYDL